MTERLLEAIYFATNKHVEQKRKDNKTPYISHPLAVALILTTVTKDEDVIIAGILHDTIEDTNTSRKELEKSFGERVAKLILECSEDDRNLSWKERKNAVLEKIKTISDNAALIKSADILHNLYEIRNKIEEHGVSFMRSFNASYQDKITYEHRRLEELKIYHPNSLLKGIADGIGAVERLVEKSI